MSESPKGVGSNLSASGSFNQVFPSTKYLKIYSLPASNSTWTEYSPVLVFDQKKDPDLSFPRTCRHAGRY
ncbi:MAG: hypothetical protein ACYC6P_13455 [Ignavibacteriaceae bacterium]